MLDFLANTKLTVRAKVNVEMLYEAVTSEEGKELLDTDTCIKKVTNPFGSCASHHAPNLHSL